MLQTRKSPCDGSPHIEIQNHKRSGWLVVLPPCLPLFSRVVFGNVFSTAVNTGSLAWTRIAALASHIKPGITGAIGDITKRDVASRSRV